MFNSDFFKYVHLTFMIEEYVKYVAKNQSAIIVL